MTIEAIRTIDCYLGGKRVDGREFNGALRELRDELARVTAERDKANQRVREMEDEPLEFGTFPDDASDRDVLLYVADCASRWAPGVRLLGNARARDVARACVNAAAGLDAKYGA